jgi:gas vesicle protein
MNQADNELDVLLQAPLTATQENKGGRWKLPDIDLNAFQQAKAQVSDQAVQMAQSTAANTQDLVSKATDQALRSSIEQTMNALQIAVEQIHSRNIPAQTAVLTGSINVGVVQLSISVDIPMNERTGDILIEVDK